MILSHSCTPKLHPKSHEKGGGRLLFLGYVIISIGWRRCVGISPSHNLTINLTNNHYSYQLDRELSMFPIVSDIVTVEYGR